MNYHKTLKTRFSHVLNSNKNGFYPLLTEDRIVYESKSFFVAKDGFPVSNGHLLIISKRVVSDYFDLSDNEQSELNRVIKNAKKIIESQYSPSGYNIGMNCGRAAGQTVMHFHCHLIPRYFGDVKDPRGGIRNCIPEKGNYLKKKKEYCPQQRIKRQ